MKETVNIVWFKKDLRLQDHLPLYTAAEQHLPVILLYCFEPDILEDKTTDFRHTRFIYESLQQLQKQLISHQHILNIAFKNIIEVFATIQEHYIIKSIFSYQEIGNYTTFKRDIAVKKYLQQKGIPWIEYPTNGIRRGLTNRKDFNSYWLTVMSSEILITDLQKIKTIQLNTAITGYNNLPTCVINKDKNFQPGGEIFGHRYIHSFLYERKSNYSKHISKPQLSRISCSRISPYLTYGNLSVKQVYQKALQAIKDTGDKKNINFFINRLHWHCHFIQKFESDYTIEFHNLNKGFNSIRNTINETYLTAWMNGTTGYPLVDACMRCVQATGYLNFRMRSMLVSFLTHHLWQPWQAGTTHLARAFLDYEPGIHYPQFQMQAGTMGVNTIRIYNPVKQSIEQDADAQFIKQWLPELKHIPHTLIHTPWKITPLDISPTIFKPGKHYPAPIVNIEKAAQYAREQLWKIKKTSVTRTENKRILEIHTNRKTEKEKPLQIAKDIQ
jgi:deoxyribodipyrimidine photo-lyase